MPLGSYVKKCPVIYFLFLLKSQNETFDENNQNFYCLGEKQI